jgi:hypothetical protein
MRRAAVVMIAIALAACSGDAKRNANPLSKEPLSVRGWIAEVDNAGPGDRFRTVETENARRAAAFQATNIWVDNAPYASGGVAENGAFILLDVPPGNPKIGLQVPNMPQVALPLENVPGNADVFVPGLIVKAGGVTVENPKAIQVRVAAKVSKPEPSGVTARVAGVTVPVTRVPINSLIDRHDYPTPPGNAAPLATVR